MPGRGRQRSSSHCSATGKGAAAAEELAAAGLIITGDSAVRPRVGMSSCMDGPPERQRWGATCMAFVALHTCNRLPAATNASSEPYPSLLPGKHPKSQAPVIGHAMLQHTSINLPTLVLD